MTIDEINNQMFIESEEVCGDTMIDLFSAQEYVEQAYKQSRQDAIEPFIKCEEDLKHLEKLMVLMFEKWDCFKQLSELESMGISIVSEGMQTIGYILDQIKQMKEGADNNGL